MSMRRSRRCTTASASPAPSCQICGEHFPSPLHYDPLNYENLILKHMKKCSASPSALLPSKDKHFRHASSSTVTTASMSSYEEDAKKPPPTKISVNSVSQDKATPQLKQSPAPVVTPNITSTSRSPTPQLHKVHARQSPAKKAPPSVNNASQDKATPQSHDQVYVNQSSSATPNNVCVADACQDIATPQGGQVHVKQSPATATVVTPDSTPSSCASFAPAAPRKAYAIKQCALPTKKKPPTKQKSNVKFQSVTCPVCNRNLAYPAARLDEAILRHVTLCSEKAAHRKTSRKSASPSSSNKQDENTATKEEQSMDQSSYATLPTGGDVTTLEESSSSKEESSSVLSLPPLHPGHLLAQSWWRRQTKKRKVSRLTVPFDIQQCLVVKNEDNEDDAEVKPATGRKLRASTRSSKESLQVICPVCKKPFDMSRMTMTEIAMKRHLAQCSRKLLHDDGTNNEKMDLEDLAVVSALSRGSNLSNIGANDYGSEANVAARARRKASVQFVLQGAGKRALDELAFGDNKSRRKRRK